MKPLYPVRIFSLNKTSTKLNAVFDTGSYFSIVRADKLPRNTTVIKQDLVFRTANKKGSLKIQGQTILTIEIGKKMVQDAVLVSSELGSDMLIGAKTMQSWDISVMNSNGKTRITVKHDMRDPEITEVDNLR
jgi:hypothetical protein